MMKKQIKKVVAALLICLTVFGIALEGKVEAATTLSVEQRVYNYLVSEMKLNTAACGVMANIEYESNFRLGNISDGGTSYGLCQWHKGRWRSLKSYCSKNGLNATSLEGQLAFLNYELAKNYGKVYRYIHNVSNTAGGAYDAAYYWCYYYEVPTNRGSKAVKRGNVARNKYWKRYKGYNGKTIVGVVPVSVSSKKETTVSSYVKTSSPDVYSRVLKKGLKGDDVKYIQQKLKDLGYSVSVDGDFGNGTLNAVRQFQTDNGMTADGVCGPATWKKIAASQAKAISAAQSGKSGKAVTGISIARQPSKQLYYAGEKLDTTNLRIKVTYADGTTKTFNQGYTCSVTKFTKTGTRKVTVSYGGKSTSFKVTVKKASEVPVSVSIHTKPDKRTYKKGEKLDVSGMKLKVTYADGSTKLVTKGYTCKPYSKLEVKGTQKITVRYGECSTSYTVTVK